MLKTVKNTTVISAVALALAAPATGTAQAAPAKPMPGSTGQSASAAAPVHPDAAGDAPAGRRTFTSTSIRGSGRSTLRITLDARRDGSAPALTSSERKQLDFVLGKPWAVPASAAPAGARVPAAAPDARRRGPAILRCGRNPRWSDTNGTLHARFNCLYSTINWGFRISRRVQSVITGPVRERGVSWWRNGRAMPRNAGHVVGKNYLFHGTLKPVRHDDLVQFQDYMTFPVRIGGRPGVGSLSWAASVKAKR
ncbi:hypothetical protein KBZ10_03710 [Streptomyces sp. F63]|uniref:hypothetical protein n=1 Tax=Streptomyces sp. F63 TaxID=2824887 RepID=UPI001B36F1BE|nr:hypothetical protein [Streptomyces sp. F63]MBQ0983643.1 hypothetical protein [Streptomyces sp. F63]